MKAATKSPSSLSAGAPQDIAALEQAFLNAKATVGVIGLGYVGIPLVSALYRPGFRIVGFDIDSERVNLLNAGQSPMKHIPTEHIREFRDSGRFEATGDFSKLAEVDAIIICVPTPLSKHREPDLSYIENTARVIAQHLRPGQLIALESTTYPGTTKEVVRKILEDNTPYKSGRDFFLAFSPEREDPGNEGYTAATIPKVVGGDGPDALRLARALYGKIIAKIVPVSTLETAEAVKLTENIFRAVNIALVNELKVIYSAMGIDVWEVIDAAATKPFGFMPFYPGPGLGGHCIPIDPFYLTWKAREFDIHTRFIELAGEINNNMMRYVVDGLNRAMNRRFKTTVNGSDILLVGLAYKKNVDDMRESPALKIWKMITNMGGRVAYHDPYVPVVPKSRAHADLKGQKSVDLTPENLKKFHACMIVTDHDNIDYKTLVEHCPLVIDTRNACERAGLSGANIVKS